MGLTAAQDRLDSLISILQLNSRFAVHLYRHSPGETISDFVHYSR